MIASDSQGFLVGAPAADFLRRVAASNDSILVEIRALRRDLKPLSAASKLDANAKSRTINRPGIKDASVKAAATAAVAAVVRRAVQLPARNAKGQFVSAKAIRSVTLPGRNDRGRFVAPGNSVGPMSPTAPAGSTPGKSKPPSDEGPSVPRSPGNGFRRQALAGLIGQGAEYDASIAAGREVTGLLKPAYDLVRGDPAARRERREERKAESRQKRSEAWYKRIFKALGGEHPVEKKKGSGLLGMLVSLLLPLIGVLLAPFKMLGRLFGLGGGMGVGGVLAGGRLGKLGRLGKFGRAFFKRLPIIGTILSALSYGSDALGDEMNPALSDTQRRSARYQNGGRAVGGIGGAVIGGILGLAAGPVGGAAGSLLGGIVGETLGKHFGKWTQSLIDADVPSRLTSTWTGFVGWLQRKTGIGGSPSSTTQPSLTTAPGGGYLAAVGRMESSNAYRDTRQRDAYLAGVKGATTASGKYGFLDGTFAGVVSRHGTESQFLTKLQPMAAAYVADKRGTRAKGLDPMYSPLFDAKLDPNSSEAVMSIFTAENKAKLAAVGISNPTDAQLYSVHLTGNTKLALAMRNSPGAIVGAAGSGISAGQIASNQGLFTGVQTVGDLQAKLDKRIGGGISVATQPAPKVNSMPQVRDAPLSSNGAQIQVVPVPIQSVGQDLSDRAIAHVVTGGLGGGMR